MYIQISNLSKSFGGQDVLKNASFTINETEHVALLGKNGSGKSTLFRILVGDEVPDSGTVIINPKNANIGYLPQTITDPDLEDLSSGQRIKKYLGKLLARNPDMLLLDEPTNHLDWESLDWLENVVTNFHGPVFVVSHDRWFLDKTVNKILELEDGGIKTFGGNYSFYKKEKDVQKNAQLRAFKEQTTRVSRLIERAKIMKNRTQQLEVRTTGADYYVRKKAAKAASAALSIEKRIAKELTESKVQKPEPRWELKALFKPEIESSQTVIQIKSVSKSFGSKKVLENISFVIQKGERVVLIGNNGSGKTTLVKLILGELKPDAGEIKIGSSVQIGYLSQEHQELSGDNTVLDELISERVDKTEAYMLLNRFLLTTEKINQPVRLLSSGEKAKLLLAKIMTKGANFIILDEPTNHLDIPSREAIEESFANYTGTLLVVSHDRYFLERLGITDYHLIDGGRLTKLY